MGEILAGYLIALIIILLLIIGMGIWLFKQHKKIQDLKKELVDLTDYTVVNNPQKENYDLDKFRHNLNTFSSAKLNKSIVDIYHTKNFNMNQIYLKYVKGLDIPTLEYGIIRMNILENINDVSKIFAGMVALSVFLVTSYNSFSQSILPESITFQAILSLVVSMIVFFIIAKFMTTQRINHSPAIFFKGLFEYELKRIEKLESIKE